MESNRFFVHLCHIDLIFLNVVHWESVGVLRELGIYNWKTPMCY